MHRKIHRFRSENNIYNLKVADLFVIMRMTGENQEDISIKNRIGTVFCYVYSGSVFDKNYLVKIMTMHDFIPKMIFEVYYSDRRCPFLEI